MKKTQKITLLCAILAIIVSLVIAGVTGGALNTVSCPDCEDGITDCGECGGSGKLDVKDPANAEKTVERDCHVCDATGKVPCETCAYDCEGPAEGIDCDGGTAICSACADTANTDCKICDNLVRFECPECEGRGTLSSGEVQGSFWALIPPVIAIGLALITKEVYSSLFVGIISGALLAANFAPAKALDTAIGTGLIDAVSGTAGIFIFLVELGVIVALINKAGGSRAFGEWAQTHIKSRAGAQLATFALGVLIFIDDYFNCLTVGSVMRPVTDKHKVSRSKLSYIIDATAAPICMIAPISSWAAAVAQYAEDGQGLKLFVTAIPYNFYSLLTLVFIISIVLMKFDYGKMRTHEYNAVKNGDLYTEGDRAESVAVDPSANGKVIDLVLPIVFLIIVSVIALVYVGGFFGVDAWGGTDCKGDFIAAFGNTDATIGLPWGGLFSLIVITAYMIIRKLVSFKESMGCIPQGFIAMVPAILILTFATGLKNITTVLGAKYFVGDLMSGAEALANFLPAIIFLVACVLAFATGTSWGTFGILIPIVTSIFVHPGQEELLIIGMSACLAGAVCGDHCSPISDTTIMSSAGGQCNHLNHVSTQIPYAVSVAAISFVMYIIAGFVQNWLICLPLGILLTVGFLFVMKKIEDKRHPETKLD